MHQLDIEVEDLKNREYQKNSSLQKQKIIWEDMGNTKMVLANKISKNMQDSWRKKS